MRRFAVAAALVAAVAVVGPAGASPTWSAPVVVNDSAAQVSTVTCLSDGNCVAWADYNDGTGNQEAFVVSESNGTWGAPVELAGNLNATSNGFAQVNSVSCSSVGNCVAGGLYDFQDPNQPNHFIQEGFVATETDGTWGDATEVAGDLNLIDGTVNSVSCWSDGNCVAVGSAGASLSEVAFAVVESNGSWGPTTDVAPDIENNDGGAELTSVACSADGTCVAGGGWTFGFSSAAVAPAFVVSESSGTWGTPTTLTSGTGLVESISCPSDGGCTAAGFDVGAFGHEQAFVADESGGSWGSATEVATSLNAGNEGRLLSVSCASPGNCAAGGFYMDASFNQEAFVIGESGGTWGSANELAGTLNAGGSAQVSSVSCASAGSCSAVGYYQDGNFALQAFVADETTGSWGSATEVAGDQNVGGTAALFGVSCLSDGSCTAGGFYDGPSNTLPAFGNVPVAFVIAHGPTALPQQITFTSSPPSPALVGGTYQVTATGGDSGNPVVFSIDATSAAGACSITTGSTVNLTGPGTCVIDADQAGSTGFLAAPQAQQQLTITEPPCAAGTYSSTGLAPCTPAPVGTYVATTGATAPTPCPTGTTTSSTGSTSATACHATTTTLTTTITQTVSDPATVTALQTSVTTAQQSATLGNYTAAANQVGAYLNKVQAALKSGKISAATATLLTNLGTQIQAAYKARHNP